MIGLYDMETVRANVRRLTKERGLTQEDLATLVDRHPVTVNRVLGGRFDLTPEWLDAFAGALKVDPESLVRTSPMRAVAVKAYVQAGYWTESTEWPRDRWYDVAIPDDPALRGLRLYAAETRGPSMDLRYPEGTVLIFTDVNETGERIAPGNRYVIERIRAGGDREMTVKRLDRDAEGRLWLMPESGDPRFSAPIPVEGEDGDTVRIVGRVVWSCRRE